VTFSITADPYRDSLCRVHFGAMTHSITTFNKMTLRFIPIGLLKCFLVFCYAAY